MTSRPDKIVPLHASLEELRRQIDLIDDSLLELIEQRLAATEAVAALKQGQGDDRLKLRPAREAAILDRLIGRAGQASPELVTLIWRALMSYGLQAQARTALVLCAARDSTGLFELTRRHFGPAGEIYWADSPAEALKAASHSEAVAVIEAGLHYELEDERLIVFHTLCRDDGAPMAVAIGRVAPEDAVTGIKACAQSQAGEKGAP
jgi:chorismate mutase